MEISVLGLPVRTVSGQNLGRVIGVTIDPVTHGVMHYEVRARRLPGVGHTHLISAPQVRSISEDEVIVDDASMPQAAPVLAASM